MHNSKEMAEIASLYTEENNYDRDGNYSESTKVDMSNVRIPIDLRLPNKMLHIVKEFAKRSNTTHIDLIETWLEQCLRKESNLFLQKNKPEAVMKLDSETIRTDIADIERAQAAYSAYGSVTEYKNYQGNPMPAWEELPAKIQEAWMAAGKAAVKFDLEYKNKILKEGMEALNSVLKEKSEMSGSPTEGERPTLLQRIGDGMRSHPDFAALKPLLDGLLNEKESAAL